MAKSKAATDEPAMTEAQTAQVETPAERKEKTLTVIDWLVKDGLADKKTIRKGEMKTVRIIPTSLGAALAGFNGWAMGQTLTESQYQAGLRAMKSKAAGSSVKKRLAGKGGGK